MEIYVYLVLINGAIVLIGNALARQYIERTAAIGGLVTGCMLLAFAQRGFLSAWAPGVPQPRWMFSRLERFSSCPAVEYILVEGISHEHSRGNYFGAHSLSTIGDLKGPTLGSTVPGALGGPGVFLLFAGLAAIRAILFVVGTRIRPPEPQHRHPR
ncbi:MULTISPECIES: hypothetical protein [Agrobacterium]|uniref:hypothetical protein n=1 Tax=Agrobacterium TaxID=357 RepID=UPI000DD2EF14|nr:hypothetical protein [Agrobacterium sp. SORGH_AS_0745]MDP9759438.1 hypothetical protein [Agrobacterium tumefaciens]MDQ1223243.1 hypothetical protein [Agrobacterium sp. SORGH_AS_0745]